MKNETRFTPTVMKELNRKQKRASTAAMIAGLVGMALYAVLAVLIKPLDGIVDILLWASIIAIVTSIAIIASVKAAEKESASSYGKINYYEFSNDYFTVKTECNGEVVSDSRMLYSEVIRYTESESYIFVFVGGKQAYPVAKSGFDGGDTETLKEYLNKGISYRSK